MKRKDIKRFWSKVRKTRGCWKWTGYKELGYGRMRINNKNKGAHRISWSLVNGKIPKGLFILHRCDNPSCVKPDHLFIGTQKDNITDMINKKRDAIKGSRNHQAKLTEKIVLEIKTKYSDRSLSERKLAKLYKVGRSTISDIFAGRCWSHVKV